MNDEVLLAVTEAKDALIHFPWDFKDRADSEELDDICRRYLEDWRVHFGRDPSPQEENYEWEACRRFHFLRKHLDVIAGLRQFCHRFVQELTGAGGQHLLGQRAMLPEVPPSQRPSASVCYGPVKLPSRLSLSYTDYEEDAGGPHVLGARVLWWLAASMAPKAFGYSDALPLKLMTIPIWTTVSPARLSRCLDSLAEVGMANPQPVEAARDAARTVCELLGLPDSIRGGQAAAKSARSVEPTVLESKEDQQSHKAEFYQSGLVWIVSYGGKTTHLPQMKGMEHIHLLLSHPGERQYVLDMDRKTKPGTRPYHLDEAAAFQQGLSVGRGSRDTGYAMDNEGVGSIGRRVLEIDAELEEARTNGDSLLVEELEREKLEHMDYLQGAGVCGPYGKRKLGDEVEKARKRIRERIQLALRKIRAVHREAGDHLIGAIDLGRFCVYTCPSPPAWRTDPSGP